MDFNQSNSLRTNKETNPHDFQTDYHVFSSSTFQMINFMINHMTKCGTMTDRFVTDKGNIHQVKMNSSHLNPLYKTHFKDNL